MLDALAFEFDRLELKKGDKLTRRIVINLGDAIGWTPKEVVRGLERLGRCRPGSWEWFQANGGIPKYQIEQVRRDRAFQTSVSSQGDDNAS